MDPKVLWPVIRRLLEEGAGERAVREKEAVCVEDVAVDEVDSCSPDSISVKHNPINAVAKKRKKKRI